MYCESCPSRNQHSNTNNNERKSTIKTNQYGPFNAAFINNTGTVLKIQVFRDICCLIFHTACGKDQMHASLVITLPRDNHSGPVTKNSNIVISGRNSECLEEMWRNRCKEKVSNTDEARWRQLER